MNDTGPLELEFNELDRTHLAAAASHYCDHLDKLAKAAKDLGRTHDEVGYLEESEKWRTELVKPVDGGELVVFFPRHMPVLEKGCIILAQRMKLVKGSLKPFRSFEPVRAELEEESNHILNELSVQFTPVMAGQAAEGEAS